MNPTEDVSPGSLGVAPGADGRLARALEEYRGLLEAGAVPDREAFLARHAEIAAELAECLSGLEFVHAVAPSLSGAAAEAAAAADPGGGVCSGALLGDFRIVRQVGRGGMGVVYEAEQVSLGRRVALKVLPFAATMDSRQLQRFHNEARAAAGLHHTNIVPVYAVGQERGVHYYAMQFIEGRTLAEVIAQQRREAVRQTPTVGEPEATTVPPAAQATSTAPRDAAYFRRAAEWGIQAAEALDCAHSLGVVHRDVKPANLLVDVAGRLWVTDFGLAQVQSDARLTLTGDLVGTLRYMSPEQALAKRVVIDHRTDVYSLGATLYELLTLQPAFSGTDRQELLRQIAFEEPKTPRRLNRAIPAELETIVLKALEKNPAERYATAKELADDLRHWLEDRPIQARRPSWLQVARKWARRHQTEVWAVTAVLVLGVAMLAGSIGWQAHGWETRRELTAQAVGQALDEAASWQQQRRLPEALSAVRRADGLVRGGTADEALRRRVQARLADLELLQALDKARRESLAFTDGSFAFKRSDGLYGDAFRGAGLDVEGLSVEEAGDRLRRTTVAAELAAALDWWALLRRQIRPPGDRTWRHLLAVGRQAEPDGTPARVRDVLGGMERQALVDLAASEGARDLLSPTLHALAIALIQGKAPGDAEVLLWEAQRRHPDDYWINDLLGFTLQYVKKPPDHANAIRFYQAAIALRPDSPTVRNNLGDALRVTGLLKGAIRELQAAIQLDPNFAAAHSNLSIALLVAGDLEGAFHEVETAIQLDLKYGQTHNDHYGRIHNDLGNAFAARGDLDRAIRGFDRAIELAPQYAPAHSNKGETLRERGDLNGAIRECQAAIQLDPNFAAARANLGLAFLDQGRFAEASTSTRKALELLPPDAPLRPAIAQQLRRCETALALDAKLPAVLQGTAKPGDPTEAAALAQLCQRPYRKCYAGSYRLYAEAFAGEPKLAEDLTAQHRYNAACAAALASCGQGKDADKLDPKERTRQRQQALDWLRADLQAYRQMLEKAADKAGPAIAQQMQHWLNDGDLAGVRGAESLARLPEAERKDWQTLWAEVETRRQQAAPQPNAASSTRP